MNVVTRGIRNAFRNGIRTLSIVIILSLSVGLSLAMLISRQAVQSKINSINSSIGNTISVSPAGSRGFEGGGNPLTTAQMKEVASIPHVTSIVETLSDRLTTSNTNLVSAIDAGSLGKRFASTSGITFSQNSGGTSVSASGGPNSGTFSFTPPITVTGTNNVENPSIYSATSVKLTSGKTFDPSIDSDVAIVGSSLASKNNLKVGSTFTAYSTTFTVVGIYDAGNTFSNAGIIMPLPTVQRLSSQPGDITSATVLVDSVDNLNSTTTAITNKLGSAADVVNSQTTATTAIAPLQNIKSISLFSLIGAVVAGAAIILLTMMMIVRERRREIGVMKAIGASNLNTTLQFVCEAITFTVLAAVIGIGIGIAAASPLTKVLVNNSNTSTSTTSGFSIAGSSAGPTTTTVSTSGGGGGIRFARAFGSNSVTNVKDIKDTIGLSVILYGFLAALVIAILGSAIPAYLISKVRPAEVMRAE